MYPIHHFIKKSGVCTGDIIEKRTLSEKECAGNCLDNDRC